MVQHHFAEVMNPNGIYLATLLTESDFVRVRGVFKVLVNVTVIALVLCSLPEFDILYLLDLPYETTPSLLPSVFRKIYIQKVFNL